ncbi:MAG: hypothetical protein COB02_05320 [Candidatus Cloacimonadota bacterium]|nr:MAG: hypothetical protein COB02_05320 [Candidatus Cloacimonadota bacterium]
MITTIPTIYGVKQSPFVRKVRVALIQKNLEFNLITIMPGDSRKTFRSISPFGKIPGFRHGSVKLCDSTVICNYLENLYPTPSIFPKDSVLLSKAQWFEEFADDLMAKYLTNILMYQCFLKPAFRNIPPNKEVVSETLLEKVPPLFQYLEKKFFKINF